MDKTDIFLYVGCFICILIIVSFMTNTIMTSNGYDNACESINMTHLNMDNRHYCLDNHNNACNVIFECKGFFNVKCTPKLFIIIN